MVQNLRKVARERPDISFKKLMTTAEAYYKSKIEIETEKAQPIADFEEFSDDLDCSFIFAGKCRKGKPILAFLDCIVDLTEETMLVELSQGMSLVVGGAGGDLVFSGLKSYFQSINPSPFYDKFFDKDVEWWNSKLKRVGVNINLDTGIQAALYSVTDAVVSREESCGNDIRYTHTDTPEVFLETPNRPEPRAKIMKRRSLWVV